MKAISDTFWRLFFKTIQFISKRDFVENACSKNNRNVKYFVVLILVR